MDLLQALILGIIQGLTEFLPVSSSGHLEIGKVLLDVHIEESLSFSVAVHGATVLSTVVVFRNDIVSILKGFFQFKWNTETRFVLMIFLSLIPVAIVGFFFEQRVESLFTGNLLLVGSMLLITAALLTLSMVVKQRKEKPIGFADALIIGIAQALAVIPGISRSGATIASGLILGNNRTEVARFSFLMVLIPILGANFLDIVKGNFSSEAGAGIGAIIIGSIAAFVFGYLACRWMISLVKKGKLMWFAVYCSIVGIISILSVIL
jgi:undecaprenyl-diphosphatase